MTGAAVKVIVFAEALPPGVTTATFPVAPFPATASIRLSLITVKEVASTPPNFTEVVRFKDVPFIVTIDPGPTIEGEKEEIVGAGINVNPGKEPVPPGVVTLMLPEPPPITTADIVLGLTTANDDALNVPNLTAVAPVKLEPLIVTVAPEPADTGLKDVIIGGGINVNPFIDEVPNAFVTEIGPDTPFPTTAANVVLLTTLKELAATPPKLTAVVPVKFIPEIVTVVPKPAAVGVKEFIIGTGA